jgi:hypothetical protein
MFCCKKELEYECVTQRAPVKRGPSNRYKTLSFIYEGYMIKPIRTRDNWIMFEKGWVQIEDAKGIILCNKSMFDRKSKNCKMCGEKLNCRYFCLKCGNVFCNDCFNNNYKIRLCKVCDLRFNH